MESADPLRRLRVAQRLVDLRAAEAARLAVAAPGGAEPDPAPGTAEATGTVPATVAVAVADTVDGTAPDAVPVAVPDADAVADTGAVPDADTVAVPDAVPDADTVTERVAEAAASSVPGTDGGSGTAPRTVAEPAPASDRLRGSGPASELLEHPTAPPAGPAVVVGVDPDDDQAGGTWQGQESAARRIAALLRDSGGRGIQR